MTMTRFILPVAFAAMLVLTPVAAWSAADPTVSADEAAPVSAVTDEHAATSGEQAAEGHGESGGLPQLNIGTYPSQIFWLMVSFCVLYLAFSKKVLPSIASVVDGRDNLIKGNLDEAERLKKEAESIQALYEKGLEQSRADAIKAVQDVEAAAKKKAADQMEVLRKKADAETKSAEDRVLVVKDKAMGEMANVAAEVASIAAEKITGIGTDMQKARAIVDSIAGKAKAA